MQESQFSPDGARLCAITASIPAASTLFGLMRGLRGRFTTKDCKEEGSCGKLNVNTLLWSPHGRLLLLGVGLLQPARFAGLREPQRGHLHLGRRGPEADRAVPHGLHHLVRVGSEQPLFDSGHLLSAHEGR